MLLVTKAEVKDELGIDDSHDDFLDILILRVSLTIEKYVGYSLDPVTMTDYFDGKYTEYFTLFPTNDENSITVTDRVTLETYEIDLVEGRHVLLAEETNLGRKNVKIEYPFGYANTAAVPEDIKGVAISWINAKFQENQAQGVTQQVAKSEKIEDLSVSYFTPEELIKAGIGGVDDFAILDTYKIISFV